MKKSVWYLVGVLILVLALVAIACAKPAEKPAAPAAPAAPTPPATAPAPAPALAPTEKAPAPTGGTIYQVTIKNFAFSPSPITIKVGDTVTWTNQDSATHTATGSSFNSGNLATGQSWSYTFKTVGTFTYKCTIHPSIRGQVAVENGGASKAPAPAPVPPPTEKASAPAAFTTSNLTISPTEVDTGKSVTISVLVTNTGGLTGSYKVTLKIDNIVVATEDVTLTGGANQTVTFVTAKNVAGTYSVNVDGLSGTFTVKTASAPAGGGSGDYGY